MTLLDLPADAPRRERRVVPRDRGRSDRVYRGLVTGAALSTLVLLVLIGLFLLIRSWPALSTAGWDFLTTRVWQPEQDRFGIAALLYWTVVIAGIALVVAVPVSVASALFITEYAPARVRSAMTALVDLLAAVPSLVYGLWGLFFLQPLLVGVARWLTDHAGFIPVFATDRPLYTNSAFVAGLVVALMVIPITTSVVREVFSQAPPGEKEAALALGATRWAMIRTVVLPFGRGGIIGGSMLGLGRALGETIAVAVVISQTFTISANWLQAGANSVAAHIALQFGEATPEKGLPALLAAGLALFVVTLAVNTLASAVVARSRSGAGVEI